MHKEMERGWLADGLATLRRRDTSGAGTGLCRALAAQLGIDVALVRAAFVALTFCSGFGLALYAWGTLLTAGPSGQRPIDQAIGGFSTWPKGAQFGLVIGSTIAVIMTVGSLTPLPWFLAILALVPLVWFLRKHSPQLRGAEVALPSMDEDELVADWRTRMSAAAGSSREPVALPVLDLEPPPPPQPPSPAARSWLGGGLILALGALVWALCQTVLALPMATSMALATLVLGAASVLFASLSRSKSLPRPFLAVLIAALIGCGWVTTAPSMRALPDESTRSVKAFATTTTVDLRDMDLAAVDTIEVVAVASTVRIIVPGPPEDGVNTAKRFSSVEISDLTGPTWEGKRLVIDATASTVTIFEEGP